jgi:carbonic anhydrase/acetyltransferase-like protein (isoleucine patch superfamily)
MLPVREEMRMMNKYRLSEETRTYDYLHAGNRTSVSLRQIIALRDFADVTAGSYGGWISEGSVLSQEGHCWIYDPESVAFAGACIEHNARIVDPCVISHQALISDNVTIQASQIRGECHLFGHARILDGSEIIAARGMTPEHDQYLQIYDRATVSRSRVVHQAQIYGDAIVHQGFIEHRAEIFDTAMIEGNEENNVWVCDCAKVYGNARLIAGLGEDAIPTLRYNAQVAENAVVEGNCVLRRHVLVGGRAWIQGGPVLLDDRVIIQGRARIRGDVIVEHQVEMSDDAVIETFDGERIHVHGQKVINGSERITRSPLLGSL